MKQHHCGGGDGGGGSYGVGGYGNCDNYSSSGGGYGDAANYGLGSYGGHADRPEIGHHGTHNPHYADHGGMGGGAMGVGGMGGDSVSGGMGCGGMGCGVMGGSAGSIGDAMGGVMGGPEMGSGSLRSAGERAAADMLWGQAMAPSSSARGSSASLNANASSFDYNSSAPAFGGSSSFGSGETSRAPSLESASLRAAADSLWMATAKAPGSSASNTPPLVPQSTRTPPPLGNGALPPQQQLTKQHAAAGLGLLNLPGLPQQGTLQFPHFSQQPQRASWATQPAKNALPSMQDKEANAMCAAAGQLWMGSTGSSPPTAGVAAAPSTPPSMPSSMLAPHDTLAPQGVRGLLGGISATPSIPDGLLDSTDLLAQLRLDSSSERPLPGMPLPGMPPSLPPSAPTSCDVSAVSTRTASPLEAFERQIDAGFNGSDAAGAESSGP